MRRLGAALIASATLLAAAEARAWGIPTHKWVAARAVELAAERCGVFVTEHRDELVARSIEPDTVLKAVLGDKERVRHFLDLDEYGAPPFTELPRERADAFRRFGRDVVEARGVLPWHVGRLARQLGAQLGAGQIPDAVISAGYLAHYASDATMPLHSTKNHDGQLTDQRGVHARVEQKLITPRLAKYGRLARAVPAREPIPPAESERALFATLEDAFDDVAPLLAADREAARFTQPGSAVYFRRFDEAVAPMLGRRIGEAAALVAALWEGACVMATPPAPPGTPPTPPRHTERTVPR